MATPERCGVLVVGDEILAGKRTDRHFTHVVETLGRRGMQVAWSRVVGDDRRRLADELKLTQQDVVPVFCFGGIGATPARRRPTLLVCGWSGIPGRRP